MRKLCCALVLFLFLSMLVACDDKGTSGSNKVEGSSSQVKSEKKENAVDKLAREYEEKGIFPKNRW